MGKRKKWKKPLGILSIVLLAAYVAACNILVNVALVPETMERLQAFEDLTEEGMEALVWTDGILENQAESRDETKEWLEEADSELLTVTTEDGYRLVGQVFYQPETAGHKWVLLLHGYTGWKEEMYPIACRYAKEGYQILVPDMRCSGESEGDFIGMGWIDRLDNLLWLEWILTEDPEAEIAIHGQSMGAACALMMSGVEELPEAVRAIVADSAYTDAYEMFAKQMKEWANLPAFPLLPGASFMLKLRGGYSLKEASALRAVEQTSIPLLFIHGTEDVFVPPEMTKELYGAASGEKELLMVEGAGHVQVQDKEPELYYGKVFSFLEAHGFR